MHGTLDKATQDADTERLFRNIFIIAPVIARCNNFVSAHRIAGGKFAVREGLLARLELMMILRWQFDRIPMLASTFALLLQ